MGTDNANDYHHSEYGYRVLDGVTDVIHLPPEGHRIEELNGLRSDDWDLLMPGRKRHHARTSIVPGVEEISRTLTPGVVWYLAPRIGHVSNPGGVAYGLPRAGDLGRDVVFLHIGCHPRVAVRNAYHEAQHAIEQWLTDDEIAILDAATVPQWGDDYGDDPVELRAELFADLANRLHCGGRLPNHPGVPELEVVRRIYTGEVGRRRYFSAPKVPRQQSLPASELGWNRVLRAFGVRQEANGKLVSA